MVRLRTGLALFVLCAACDEGSPSILEPSGPGARRVESLWWPMLWISVVVFLIVAGMIVYSVVRARGKDAALDKSDVRWGEPFIAIAGVFIPVLVLGAVFLMSLREMRGMAEDGEGADLQIEVTAKNWWWEASYPNGAITANEIHIPTGEPVRLKLIAADVIHSFWVPRLQVKIDHIPGHDNFLWLQADEPGTYRGQCAEFCGLQHANMAFHVVAQSPDDFTEWLRTEGSPAPSPSGAVSEGQEIFESSSCAGCHAIRGTSASAQAGPDLTHLASREWLAAGTFENNRTNLERFITDPQSMKPGVSMPPAELDSDQIEALVDYLERLK